MSRMLPNGTLTEYNHDMLGRTISIIESINGQNYSATTFEHDVLGNIVRQTTSFANRSHENMVEEHVFDALNRLVEHTVNGETTTFAYDTAGNLVREVNAEGTIAFTYNNLNQMLTRVNGSDSYTFIYDGRGNLIEELRNGATTRTFEFNARNMLIAGVNHETGETVELIHDSLGNQVESLRLLNNNLIGYVNNQNSTGNRHQELIEQISNENTPIVNQRVFENNLALTMQVEPMVEVSRIYIIDHTRASNNVLMSIKDGTYVIEYVFGHAGDRISQRVSHIEDITDSRGVGYNPFSRIATDLIGTAFFHEDLRGSTVRVTDEEGRTLARVIYDAWGVPLVQPVGSFNFAGIDDLINFTGYTYDRVMGVYLSRFRVYDPINRRFISEDPIRDGLNWYAYVGNNPIMYVDPLGLSPVRIRDFVVEHEGRFSWDEASGRASFTIGFTTLIISAAGGNVLGMQVTNVGGHLVANESQLANFFGVTNPTHSNRNNTIGNNLSNGANGSGNGHTTGSTNNGSNRPSVSDPAPNPGNNGGGHVNFPSFNNGNEMEYNPNEFALPYVHERGPWYGNVLNNVESVLYTRLRVQLSLFARGFGTPHRSMYSAVREWADEYGPRSDHREYGSTINVATAGIARFYFMSSTHPGFLFTTWYGVTYYTTMTVLGRTVAESLEFGARTLSDPTMPFISRPIGYAHTHPLTTSLTPSDYDFMLRDHGWVLGLTIFPIVWTDTETARTHICFEWVSLPTPPRTRPDSEPTSPVDRPQRPSF